MVRFELEKNLKHLEILIKQNHTEVEALEVDTSGDCPAVYIYYDGNKEKFSKLLFNFDDDPLNLYRRVLDDIIDRSFVSNHSLV
jgi:hypothetical protein